MKLEIYTDGSSRGNPGPAGWGVVVIIDNTKIEEYGDYKNIATNSEMEIFAVLYSLDIVLEKCKEGDEVEIYSDSNYVVQAINLWMKNWNKNGWKKADKKEIAHLKYWQDIFEKYNTIKDKIIKIKVNHIKAHNGHKYNERVDEICTGFAINKRFDLYKGILK